mgnify:CR=1 FL=1
MTSPHRTGAARHAAERGRVEHQKCQRSRRRPRPAPASPRMTTLSHEFGRRPTPAADNCHHREARAESHGGELAVRDRPRCVSRRSSTPSAPPPRPGRSAPSAGASRTRPGRSGRRSAVRASPWQRSCGGACVEAGPVVVALPCRRKSRSRAEPYGEVARPPAGATAARAGREREHQSQHQGCCDSRLRSSAPFDLEQAYRPPRATTRPLCPAISRSRPLLDRLRMVPQLFPRRRSSLVR